MNYFDSRNHTSGDLALLQDVIQICLEEIEQLLALQQAANTSRVVFDFSEAIDVRLGVISSLNRLTLNSTNNILAKFFDKTSPEPVQASKHQLAELNRLVLETSQNIELVENIQHFIKDKKVKQQIDNVLRSLKHSQQEMNKHEQQLCRDKYQELTS
ncbi:hypothetical protein [Thalassotalea marina]|uniref:Uncharacterized protein n=1 Tax=Thalassotalea marina TaxID=1673741 RepID=A0A919EPQ5_9GAMM|nr:hypothetical protein [Thalassotalea marina]GHG05110.1 hypothetical protein GCM10017161_38280 [Thalassotalea marina]